MHKDIEEILVSEEEILTISREMGKTLSKEYDGKTPIVLGLLNGCVPFLASLIKHIDIPLEVHFMSVSSYHGGLQSSGNIKIKYDLQVSVLDRDVLIVEDIVDTGATLKTVIELLKHRGAKTVKVATLLDKPSGRKFEMIPDFIGKTIPSKFVIGFGLDYEELYRNLPYVGVLKSSVYKK